MTDDDAVFFLEEIFAYETVVSDPFLACSIVLSVTRIAEMAGLMQDRFREHFSVADVLKANYGSNDDIERVEAIHALENELEQLCCSRESDVQATLRGVSKHLVLLNWYWPLCPGVKLSDGFFCNLNFFMWQRDAPGVLNCLWS